MLSKTEDWGESKSKESQAIEKLFTVGVPLPTVRSAEEIKTFLAPLFAAIEPYRSTAPK